MIPSSSDPAAVLQLGENSSNRFAWGTLGTNTSSTRLVCLTTACGRYCTVPSSELQLGTTIRLFPEEGKAPLLQALLTTALARRNTLPSTCMGGLLMYHH